MCDRGTIDGLAYWCGSDDMLASVGTSLAEELARYHAVIHLRTPSEGYDNSNPLRLETTAEAAAIDEKIAAVWATHPRGFEVPATANFLVKIARVIAIVHGELPACCHTRAIDGCLPHDLGVLARQRRRHDRCTCVECGDSNHRSADRHAADRTRVSNDGPTDPARR